MQSRKDDPLFLIYTYIQNYRERDWIVDLLRRAGTASSTSDARRLIEQGAVSIDGQKISDFNAKVPVKKGALLKAGKKKFVKIV